MFFVYVYFEFSLGLLSLIVSTFLSTYRVYIYIINTCFLFIVLLAAVFLFVLK